MGSKTLSHFLSGERDPKVLLQKQVELLSEEFGKLKGSVMKAGQMLSVFGEHFLPPEINTFFKNLQNNSPPLAWTEIEKAIKRELSPEKLAELEIDEKPFASASIGQVHLAKRRSDGKMICMKVQYPGVADAIESDLKMLRRILTFARILPEQANNEGLFQEVQEMLKQEVDYLQEQALMEKYRALVGNDPRFIIPVLYPEYSSARVIATEYIHGKALDSPEVQTLSQERRNFLSEAAQDLLFKELFRWGVMQTDPHAGNYRIQLGEVGTPDRWVLLDFGAVRIFEESFLKNYREMTWSSLDGETERAIDAATQLGFLTPNDPVEVQRSFYDLCTLFLEPFRSNQIFSWKETNVPKEAVELGRSLAMKLKFRSPPRQVVFLDRKLVGTFTLLAVLGAKFAPRDLLMKYHP